MANVMLMIEGFDRYTSPSQVTSVGKWGEGAIPNTTLSTGRGGVGKQIASSGGLDLRRPFGEFRGYGKYAWGHGFRMTDSGGTPVSPYCLSSLIAFDGKDIVHFGLSPNTGLPIVGQGADASLGYNQTFIVGNRSYADGGWHYAELIVDLQPTGETSTVRLWINGEKIGEWSGSIGRSTGVINGTTHFSLGTGYHRSQGTGFDDVYVAALDRTLEGSDPRAIADSIEFPRGDLRVATFRASTLVSSSGFAPIGAANLVAAVDGQDASIDDADYAEALALGHSALFQTTDTFPEVPKEIVAVGTVLRSRKSDVGVRGIKGRLQPASTGTVSEHVEDNYLSSTFANWQSLWGRNPNTGEAFSIADVEDASFGVVVSI